MLILPFLLLGIAVPASAQESDAGTGPMLLGPIAIEQLIDLPGWFGSEYIAFTPVQGYMDDMTQYLDGVSIVCVLGTWCGDSKREVPRLIRILQMKGLEPERLTMIGVDRSKSSPGGEAAQYGIERVPTILFFKNGNELGRIIETPIGPLEKHMLGILKGKVEEAAPPQPVVMPHTVVAPHPGDDGSIPPAADPPPPPPDGAVREIKPVTPFPLPPKSDGK